MSADADPHAFTAENVAGCFWFDRDRPRISPLDCQNDVDAIIDAIEASGSGSTMLTLHPASPLESARTFITRRHMHGLHRTLLHSNGTFFIWRGSHYRECAAEELRAQLYEFLDKASYFEKIGRSEVLAPFNPNKTKVANVLDALGAEAQLPPEIRPPAWLDGRSAPAAGDMIACSNGLLHLPTKTLHPLTPDFYSINALPFAYEPAAAAPTAWLRFLSQVWPDDQESVDTLQELFGLLLTADTRFQKAFLIVGPRRSGKGTIARVLTQLLGADNVAGPTLSSLSGTFGLQTLIGKRLALISDARLSGKVDQSIITERLLSVTGEDGQSIDRKNRTAWFGKLDVRFVLLTNELPKLNDSSGALAGRFIVWRMTQSFYGREDLGLGARLQPELPAILLWAIEGWRRLLDRGHFVTPSSAAAAQQELEELGSPIGAFIRERCAVGQGLAVQCEQLYRAWCDWCRDQGRDHPGTVQTFGRDLGAAVAGVTIKQRRDGASRLRYYDGLTMLPPEVSRDGTRASALQSQYTGDIQ